MRPAEYVAVAGASDLYETRSSQIVRQSTTDPRVRSYADMMIADHARSTAAVKIVPVVQHHVEMLKTM